MSDELHQSGVARRMSARELLQRIADLESLKVRVDASLVYGFKVLTIDGLGLETAFAKLGALPDNPSDPHIYPVTLDVFVKNGHVELLRLHEISAPTPHPVPDLSLDELQRDPVAHLGAIIDVTGTLSAGDYWPTLGPIELVIPELASHTRYSHWPCDPPPEPLVRWQSRLRKRSYRVRARGYFECDDDGSFGRLLSYRVKIVEGGDQDASPEP